MDIDTVSYVSTKLLSSLYALYFGVAVGVKEGYMGDNLFEKNPNRITASLGVTVVGDLIQHSLGMADYLVDDPVHIGAIYWGYGLGRKWGCYLNSSSEVKL